MTNDKGSEIKVYISPQLTSWQKGLPRRAKELKRQAKYEYVWANKQAKILVGKEEKSKIIEINSNHIIQELEEQAALEHPGFKPFLPTY